MFCRYIFLCTFVETKHLKVEKMNVSILYNDAFRMLQNATNLTETDLEEKIFSYFLGRQYVGMENCGSSIMDVAVQIFELEKYQIAQSIFTEIEDVTEISQILDRVFFWGEANECENCGCELDEQTESHGKYGWTTSKCINPNCDHSTSDEPDWDTMPGGHDNR